MGTETGGGFQEERVWLTGLKVMLLARDAASGGLGWFAFDPFSFQQDGLTPSEVHVSRREVAQALVVALTIVGLHEGANLGLQVSGWPAPVGWSGLNVSA